MAPEGGSHSPARLRSQHIRGHCCGTYKRTRSSPTHGHRSRKGFIQPCAKAWRPRTNPPCRHDGPQPGQGKAVADSDLAGALGQPPAPPAWTNASSCAISLLGSETSWFLPSCPRGTKLAGLKTPLWSWGPHPSPALSHPFGVPHSRAFTSRYQRAHGKPPTHR